MMKLLQQTNDHRKAFFLLLLPLLVALSLIPSMAVAETSTGNATAPGSGQSSDTLEVQASTIDADSQVGAEALQNLTAGR